MRLRCKKLQNMEQNLKNSDNSKKNLNNAQKFVIMQKNHHTNSDHSEKFKKNLLEIRNIIELSRSE
jgi:hypothetical protein